MPPPQIDTPLIARLYKRAKGDMWQLPQDVFAEALRTSATRAFGEEPPTRSDLEHRLAALHLEDLALACACAAGNETAWEHFVREQRPHLYRAADAIDPTGNARDLADALYAELYGFQGRDGNRKSLFRYFHGRSSLATWLRAVLAQRHVDRLRTIRRLEPLPEDESAAPSRVTPNDLDPERPRYLTLVRRALGLAVSKLDPRDRLRLGCYYGQSLTLAETGRLVGEHEATVSRNLARTRKAIREDVENQLRSEAGLNEAQVARCFEVASEDGRAVDLTDVLPMDDRARDQRPGRSTRERKTS
jgi:RNA polymerase sigma-70 factor (ECF subfamily)